MTFRLSARACGDKTRWQHGKEGGEGAASVTATGCTPSVAINCNHQLYAERIIVCNTFCTNALLSGC